MNNSLNKRLRQTEHGFTLIEIMLVLAIIAVLMGAAIMQLTGNVDVAKIQRANADIKTLSTQLKTYEITNYCLPSTDQGLQALVTPPSTGQKPRQWVQLLNSIPLDPWNKPYQYRNPGSKNPNGFDLFSLGRDGVESGDDIGNWGEK